MFHPRVTFHRSTKKDIETLHAFVKDAAYDNGRNLDWAVFKKYPRLKVYFDKDKNYKVINEEVLRNFINKEYRAKKTSMDRALLQHKKHWTKISLRYFSLVDKLFGSHKWPCGKYIAFVSHGAWDSFTRDFWRIKHFRFLFGIVLMDMFR